MVAQHYRWDFIGLSTDQKPTPATSEKVVDGSTFYCSDTSKLYVYCKNNWYERKPLGGGGGGGSYTAGTGIEIEDDTISVDETYVATLEELDARINKGAGAPTTATEGVVGGLYEDTTNGKLYICTAVTEGVDPDPDTYTWSEVGGGGTTYTAGANITISDGVISATDTTYSNFVGTDGSSAGTAGLVPAPATTDAGKFLKADGTWDTAGGGGGGDTVYSSKTTSNSATGGAVYIGNLGTDQAEVADPSPNDNHYKYFWALPSSNNGATYGFPGDGTVNIMGSARGAGSVTIGRSAGSGSYGAISMVAIGEGANSGNSGVSIGSGAGTTQDFTGNVCIGEGATITDFGVTNSISLGRYSKATRAGELNIGTSISHPDEGFNSSAYRVIGGVYDGQELHDAATVAQGNTLSTSAPTTATEGVLGQLWTDTTNMHTYQCTAISGSTYTWTQRW